MLGSIKAKFKNYIKSVIAEEAAITEKQTAKKHQRDFGVDISSVTLKKPDVQELLRLSFQKSAKDFTVNLGSKEVAMDSAECEMATPAVNMQGTGKDIIYTFFSKFGFIGWQQCALLFQHWLIGNACKIPPEDAIRNGWINTFADADKEPTGEDKEKQQKFLNELNDITNSEYDLSKKAIKLVVNYNIYGIGIALPKIDGIDYEKPYNPDGVKKGSFKGISVIDPYWLTPQFDKEAMTDPTSPDFYKPTHYLTADGKKIHISHFIIIRRKEVPDILKPSYYFGGIPLTQEIFERVYAAEKSANEQPLLLLTKRVDGWKVDLNEFFANPEKYEQRIRNFTDKRDNQGVLLIDHEDDMFQIDTSLSDLDEVVMSQYKLVAAVARIPVDKLFELNPSGTLSNSGDYNVKNYNQDLNSIQANLQKPLIDRINEIVMRSKYGRTDKIAIIFNPTDNPTAAEQATNVKTESDTLQGLIGSNIITTEEARQKLISDKRNGFSFLDEQVPEQEQDNEEIAQMMKEQQSKQQNQQGNDEDIAEDSDFDENKVNRDEKGRFAEKNTTVDDVIKAAKNSEEKKAYIADISDELMKDAKKHGYDLTGYTHNIDSSAVNHIFNHHGNEEKESKQGQIAVTEEDIKTLPKKIIDSYDFVAFGGKNNRNQDVIAYGKNMDDGSFVYVEEVRTGKKTLTTQTLFKRKAGITSNSFTNIVKSRAVWSNNTDNISILDKTKKVKSFVAEDEDFAQDGRWLTIHPPYGNKEDKGIPLYLEEGESPKEALNKKLKKIKDSSESSKKDSSTNIETKPKEIKKATTVNEAEIIAKDLNLADTINYKGLDIDYANTINNAIYNNFQSYPEIRNFIKTLGAAQSINKEARESFLIEHQEEIEHAVKEAIDRVFRVQKNLNGEFAERAIIGQYGSVNKMKEAVRRKVLSKFKQAVSKKVNGQAFAFFRFGYSSLDNIRDSSGIYFNAKYGKKNKIDELLKQCVVHNFHPEGCDTAKATIDHEFGHALHRYIKDNTKPNKYYQELVSYYDGLNWSQITDGLSSYASTNLSEFIAEAYSEYKNNKSPRKIASKVGGLLDKAYKETTNA